MNQVDRLSPPQQEQYERLTQEARDEIDVKITNRYDLNNFSQPEVRDSVIERYNHRTPNHINLDQAEITNAIDSAKNDLTTEYDADIARMLLGEREPLRRAIHPRQLLINKAVDVLININREPVGGKLRKSSKKRPTARRRRSSKARKSRKSRSTRRR